MHSLRDLALQIIVVKGAIQVGLMGLELLLKDVFPGEGFEPAVGFDLFGSAVGAQALGGVFVEQFGEQVAGVFADVVVREF